MVYKFEDIFKTNENGTISPTRIVSVGGCTFNSSVQLNGTSIFNGQKLIDHKNDTIEAMEDENHVLQITAWIDSSASPRFTNIGELKGLKKIAIVDTDTQNKTIISGNNLTINILE